MTVIIAPIVPVPASVGLELLPRAPGSGVKVGMAGGVSATLDTTEPFTKLAISTPPTQKRQFNLISYFDSINATQI
jgi:hypothetical protein